MRAVAFLAAACALFVVVSNALGAVDATDLLVAARALSFMEHPPAGAIRVGIVYAPTAAASAAEAQTVATLLAGGLKAGNLVLQPALVPIDAVGNADVTLFFLTDGVGAAAADVAAAAQQKRIPCVTTDIAQVQSGNCMLGVRSNPRVEILLNRAAAAKSGIAFSTAFRLLITEL